MTMHITAEELLKALASLEATLAKVSRNAGVGHDPSLERRLDTHLRSFRVLLDANGTAIAEDTIEAAKRVLDTAEPEAPLLMLKMARNSLAAVVRRQAARSESAAPRAA